MSKIRRSRYLKRTGYLLIFVFVSVFCIIFFAAKGRFTVPFSSKIVMTSLAPFQRAATWLGSGIHDITTNIWGILTVHKQNKILKNEVEELKVQNLHANELAAENIRLKALLNYKEVTTQFDLLPARVIGRDLATFTGMIIIDRGSSDGVKKNMAVVTNRGMVGSVIEAGIISSKVALLLDPRLSVGTLVQRSRVVGIVKGTLGDIFHPKMVNIPRNADILENDTIVTSGFGGIYPKGLAVGRVLKIENDSGGLLKSATIEPAVDFLTLEDVLVIKATQLPQLEQHTEIADEQLSKQNSEDIIHSLEKTIENQESRVKA